VIAEPLIAAALHEIFACPLSAVAVTAPGAPGAPEIVVELDAVEAEEVPWELVAVTVKV
jgi:hypothetical protein